MNEKIIVDPSKHKDYTDVKIGVSGDVSEEKVDVVMKLITERSYLSEEQFINRFLQVFNKSNNITYTNIDETEVLGIFYFPQDRIDTYVFSDLVMNNMLFSSLINIDESSKVTKKKSESTQPWIYIHFNHPSTGHITAAITQKVVDRSDPVMKDEDPDIFVHNQPYIRVRVKGRDRKSVKLFQELFSNLFALYNEKYNEIVDIYRQFIPNFGEIEEIDVPPLKQSDLAPEIFVKNFSRYCSEARYPTIVSEKIANKYEKEGKELMVFPRDIPKSGKKYPSDGKNQHTYVCLNPEFPFPGLQVNAKLANSDDYPYVPCCFKNDQSNKVGGIYRNYYFGEELESKDKKQQELITTDKILDNDKYGTLPEDLQKLFEILDNDSKYRYIRVGVHRNPSSFLNAVMVGLHEQTGILDLDDKDEREARLLQIRNELSSNDISAMSKQCCYDMSQKQISENLNNPEVYMDPKFYVQLLEGFFDCNIFLFNRERMFLPRFAQSLYKKRRESTCIFIYEHWGSESDNAKYPQCELIIRWNTERKDDTQFFFPYENKISSTINKVFRLLNESYRLDQKITETIFPIPEECQILSQKIDSYGKTRCLNVLYNGKKISILTDPMAPLPVEEKNDDISKVKKSLALEFLRNLKIEPDVQVLENPSKLVQINSKLGNVNISIPIIETEPIDGLRSVFGINYPKDNVSSLSIFNKNKKMSRYLTEYLFWVFSKYIQDDNISNITDKTLSKFAKKYFVIEENHQYEMVPKIFDNNNGKVMRDGKIIVQSEEMIKRLMYVLKLFSIRDIKTLRNYYIRNAITHYYVDITDFDYYPSQVILQGEDSIDKWIQESKLSTTLQKGIVIGQNTPYFFKNNLVDGKVFLAQNANSLQMALDISKNWQKSGYNSGIDTDITNKKYKFTLYSYVNPENITIQQVLGKDTQKEIRIIGYKLEGSPFYTALLELE